MWLTRLTQLLKALNGHTLIQAREQYGVSLLFQALRDERPEATVWLWLKVSEQADDIALGNRLATAVNNMLGSAVIPLAFPYGFTVHYLERMMPHLPRFRLLVSQAEVDSDFAAALLKLPRSHCQVALHSENTVSPALSADNLINEATLQITWEEAQAEALEIAPETLRRFYQATQGAYLGFNNALRNHQGYPAETLQTPEGTELRQQGEAVAVEPETLFEVLLEKRRYIEALELAVAALPAYVHQVVHEAGSRMQELGLYERLFLLLRSLDEKYLACAEILEWLLVAAAHVNQHASILPIVDDYLSRHEALHLEARRLAFITSKEERYTKARALVTRQKTPLTLFHLSIAAASPSERIAVLQEAVHLAEAEGRMYDVVRNAGALAEALIQAGRFYEGTHWAEWALRKFDTSRLQDGQRRLRVLNTLAFGRLIIGEYAGMEEELLTVQASLESYSDELVITYRSTLAELCLLTDKLEAARLLAKRNVSECERPLVGMTTTVLVRILIELGEFDQALKEAQQALSLTAFESLEYHAYSELALGMALSMTDPEAAAPYLRRVMLSEALVVDKRLVAVFYGLRCRVLTLAEVPQQLREVLDNLPSSGLRLFSGPETLFREVWRLIRNDGPALSIQLLGQPQVKRNGEVIRLAPQALHIVAVLSLQTQPVTLEQLHTALFSEFEAMTASTLYTWLSKIRAEIQISHKTYAIAEPFELDVKQFETLLTTGYLRDAITLYRGELLPGVSGPFIDDRRMELSESLRQALLLSDDVDACFAGAQILKEDYEVWLHAQRLLQRVNDPRIVMASARVNLLAPQYA